MYQQYVSFILYFNILQSHFMPRKKMETSRVLTRLKTQKSVQSHPFPLKNCKWMPVAHEMRPVYIGNIGYISNIHKPLS